MGMVDVGREVPMAVLLNSVVDPEVDAGGSRSAVATLPRSVQRRSKRARREELVVEVVAPTWVAAGVLKRTTRIMRALEDPPPPVDIEHRSTGCAVLSLLSPWR